MNYYFAPLEGLTDSIYRRLHNQYFPGLDRYYMPFISPTIHRCLTHKEDRELPPAQSVSFTAIPQILTKVPEDFLWAAQVCADRGYREVNLNLGCPSGTVVSKGKGSGMLADIPALDRFLDTVFSADPGVDISVKTRVGVADSDCFPALMEVFNRYPICELTVHPRVRKDFYNSSVRMDTYRYAAEHSRNPLCYNGDLCSPADIASFREQFPDTGAVMIGRGLMADPGMLCPGGTDAKTLENFHDALLEGYIENFGGSRNAMFRLKENWSYLLPRFADSEKLGKRLRKTTDLAEYKSITREIFRSLPLIPQTSADR